MRIYTRKEFLKLPAGVAYCKGIKWCFDGLNFKGDSLSNDWWSTDPAWVDGEDSAMCFSRLEEMLESGASYPIQEDQGRDGLFQEDDIFLVLDKYDLLKLREWTDIAILVSK